MRRASPPGEVSEKTMPKRNVAALGIILVASTQAAVGCSSSSGRGGFSGGDAGGAADASHGADGTGSPCGNACAAYQTCTAGVCTTTETCPAPPAGAPPGAAAAYTTENTARAAMGIPCASLVPALDTSATDHCNYYVANVGDSSCEGDPHVEVQGCSMYVAAQFYQREMAAGYTGLGAFEDMAFVDNGTTATQTFIDSVWHRIPVLSPWVRDMGYGGGMGNGTGCDTIDFGVGASTPLSATAVYPYPGQTGVPTSFNGALEGPTPPEPPSGWPSGYPISVYMFGAMTAPVHTITVVGDSTPIAHQFISYMGAGDPDGLLAACSTSYMGPGGNECAGAGFILYTNAPMTSSTQYHVHVEGSGTVGSEKTFDWVFTTM
jgi:hypothetical protein